MPTKGIIESITSTKKELENYGQKNPPTTPKTKPTKLYKLMNGLQ